MPHAQFPMPGKELLVEVVVGLNTAQVQVMQAAGQPIPPFIRINALIDTGTDVTAVTPAALAPLSLTPSGAVQTITAGGKVVVNYYEVSLTILRAGSTFAPAWAHGMWTITEFLHSAPGLDVLVGMDLVSEGLLIVDGPNQHFTLAW
jgi:hypothetical protein